MESFPHSGAISPESKKPELTAQDEQDREDFRYLLSIMERQGNIWGTIQSVDLEDSELHRDNIKSFCEKQSPEGSITVLFDNVIFDFDGVLHDTTYATYKATEVMLERKGDKGIPTPSTIEEIANSYQAPYQNYYKRFGITEDSTFISDYRKIRAQIDSEHHTQAALYPEVKIILNKLREAKKDNPKLTLHIVSASAPEDVMDALSVNGITGEFGEIHVEAHGKTAMIQSIADRGEKGRTIMIGDLPSDIKDAQKVEGVKTVAVARGAIERERLGMYLPDYIVTDLKGLLDLKSYSKELRERSTE